MADSRDPFEPRPIEIEVEPTVAGRLARWMGRARILQTRADAARSRHTSIDFGFSLVERDSSIGGGLLAGALFCQSVRAAVELAEGERPRRRRPRRAASGVRAAWAAKRSGTVQPGSGAGRVVPLGEDLVARRGSVSTGRAGEAQVGIGHRRRAWSRSSSNRRSTVAASNRSASYSSEPASPSG